MRPVSPESAARRQHQRPDGPMREIPEGAPGARRAPVARRARAADLRERLRPGVEDVGRPDEDDPERIPPDAVAEGSAGADWAAHGGLLLRRGRGPAARVRATADKIVRQSGRSGFQVLGSGFAFGSGTGKKTLNPER